MAWDARSAGGNVTVLADGWVEIRGAGTVLDSAGVAAGSAAWEFEVAQTGRGSWVGFVQVGASGADALLDLNLSLGALGWAIWGGETGAIHPMYARGAQSDQILGFRAGSRPALALRCGAGAGGAGGSIEYAIDDRIVGQAFGDLPALPPGGAWRLAASNGWAGTTRVRARRL